MNEFDEIVEMLREDKEMTMFTARWAEIIGSNEPGAHIQVGAAKRWETMMKRGINDDGRKFDFNTGQRI